MLHSINDFKELPSMDEVKSVAQGLALVDAIIMPEWEHRFFSFNSNWDGRGKEMMGSMRDGMGSEYFLHFSNQGVAGKVLSQIQLPEVDLCFNTIPGEFSAFKSESAFNLENATFYFWRKFEDRAWSVCPEGSDEYPLLAFLVSGCSYYEKWAETYYEKKIEKGALSRIFNSLGVTLADISLLNPETSIEALEEDIIEIGGLRK